MYLKSIEIHGFKSFANKMVFEFHDGITAIVGPNGSGKSNVADAIRWVLGEQSAKQLRGAKMEDVIFSGTQTRKPQGFAYVAITFDNSDHKLSTSYEEVTVARRVYRSGESAYLINGSNCRLKDVQELFLDTGIGKEGYSIIGQGQIDKILSGKPEERRELFDEAAGIVKFKKRKAAAEKNLEIEKQNLCRINDILSELEKQIGPLEKQSTVAREYLKLREELKHLDVNMFLLEYDRLHISTGELEKKVAIVENDLQKTKQNYEDTKEEYEKLETQIEAYDEELESERNKLNETLIKKEQLEGEIKVCNEQIIAAKQNDQHYKNRVDSVTDSIEKKQAELQQYISEKANMQETLKDLELKRSEAEKQLQGILEAIGEYGKKIDQSNNEIFEFLNLSANIKSKLQKQETILEQSNVKKAELNQRILKNKSDEAVCSENLEKEKAKLLAVSEKISKLKEANQRLEEEIHILTQKTSNLKNQQNTKQQEYHKEKSKLDSLRNITERYEGYGQSIRRVMEQKEKNTGIIGVVADIVKVKKEYETAVEIALGGSIQNIVTDNENTAKNLIEFLKRNKYGRATFLPLTTINNKNAFYNDKVLQEKGVVGLASTLIDADKKFDRLIDYLLGKIVVVDTIENAIALSSRYKNSLRIVTLEGELLSPGGSMSGGAYKNASNLLSRRREIADIEKQIKTLALELKDIETKLQADREERFEKSEKFKKNQTILQELFLEENTTKLKYEKAKEEQENIDFSYKIIAKENIDIENQTTELKNAIVQLEMQLRANTNKGKENETFIAECNRELEKQKQEEEECRKNVSEISLSYSSMEQKNQFHLENIRRVKEELEKLQEELRILSNGMSDSTSQVNEKEAEIKRIRHTLEEYHDWIKQEEADIKGINTKKEELSKSHKGFFAKREEISQYINELDKEAFRLGNQKEKLSEQLELLMNYMWEEYELTYMSALSLKTDMDMQLPQMKKTVADIKNKMKGLGDVNVNAIEDYKLISDRYELLYTQHEDLIKAEEVLRNIINELDMEMRKQFEEKFAEIKEQFHMVFKELFGGGKGTIELVEDEDILEAGVRIIAQPPGKKLQNMMQLSGGEKALTAISLLFAIQNLKPSPFCLLDEIEAALDDSNVKRYAQYLHKLTKHTQFIVITHRRGTMAAADVLYGITMQEKGVSTLVSVNLIEDELDKMEKSKQALS